MASMNAKPRGKLGVQPNVEETMRRLAMRGWRSPTLYEGNDKKEDSEEIEKEEDKKEKKEDKVEENKIEENKIEENKIEENKIEENEVQKEDEEKKKMEISNQKMLEGNKNEEEEND